MGALIGLHDSRMESMVKIDLKAAGYDVTVAETVDGMLREMGIPLDSAPDAPPTNPFELYVMDANLDSSGDESGEPSVRVYQHVKASCEAGEAKFVAISHTLMALNYAQEHGVPCVNKSDFLMHINDYV